MSTSVVRGQPRSDWWVDAVPAIVVLVLGVAEVARLLEDDQRGPYVAVLVVAGALALWRRAPGLALALAWGLALFHLATSTPVLVVEFAAALVSFGSARWGSPVTVALGGLSVPAAGVLGVLVVVFDSDLLHLVIDLGRTDSIGYAVYHLSGRSTLGLAVASTALIGTPWTAGLAVRFLVRARRSQTAQEVAQADAAVAQREAVQAQEIAELRDGQARLARDVHDVVGHSLAVILAQADSAQYLPDDPEALKRTMATIATSARSSLQDVGQVLATTSSDQPVRPGSLARLIEGVRATGHDVLDEEVGTPRPLPPELEVVAYRVLQEMLTNAVRHGIRDRPIRVERRWPESPQDRELRLSVTNGVGATDARDGGGQGIPGMRRRVETVGGRLDVGVGDDATFTATAWVPVRA